MLSVSYILSLIHDFLFVIVCVVSILWRFSPRLSQTMIFVCAILLRSFSLFLSLTKTCIPTFGLHNTLYTFDDTHQKLSERVFHSFDSILSMITTLFKV